MNLAARLEKSLSSKQLDLIRLIADEASHRGMPLYAVGGLPRDLLLNRLTRDLDLVVEGDAIPLARSLSRLHGGRVTTHLSFHTATWTLPPDLAPDTLDLISARSETYAHPAALPAVTLGTLTDDLRRRDFTISAMAIRLDGDRFGELIDPFGGLDDLKKKIIRVLHPRSFIDDPTRIFRAIRYAGRLGFALSPETKALIPAALHYVDKLSPERLRHELDLILAEDEFLAALQQFADLRVLSAVKPPLPWNASVRMRLIVLHQQVNDLESIRDLRWMLWLMDSSADEIRGFAKRLDFTSDLLKHALSASSLFAKLSSLVDATPSQCVDLLEKNPDLSVEAVRLCAPRGKARTKLGKYLSEWKTIMPHATGETLKALGLSPGPAYKRILSSLRAAWLDGEVRNEAEEKKLLKDLITK